MKRRITKGLLALLLVSSTTSAGELKDAERWKKIDGGIAAEAKEVTGNCGKPIPYSIDRKSFGKDIFRNVGPDACSVMVKAVASRCHPSYPDRNAAVLKRIKKMVCKYGGPMKASVKKEMKESAKPYDVPGSEQALRITKSGTLEWSMHYEADTEYIWFSRGESLLQDITQFLDKEL
jgi:hypothetical protein